MSDTRSWGLFVLRVSALAAIVLTGCNEGEKGVFGTEDEEAIALVAEGSLAPYPDEPIGTAAECYFDSTAWASLFGEDGFTYVNLEGYGGDGETSEALIQFRVFRGTATFTLNAMALDGVTQPDSLVLQFVEDMIACEPEE